MDLSRGLVGDRCVQAVLGEVPMRTITITTTSTALQRDNTRLGVDRFMLEQFLHIWGELKHKAKENGVPLGLVTITISGDAL